MIRLITRSVPKKASIKIGFFQDEVVDEADARNPKTCPNLYYLKKHPNQKLFDCAFCRHKCAEKIR